MPATVRLRLPVTRVDETFRALGSNVRIIVEAPHTATLAARARAAIGHSRRARLAFDPTRSCRR
jgi:hypothetical protein